MAVVLCKSLESAFTIPLLSDEDLFVNLFSRRNCQNRIGKSKFEVFFDEEKESYFWNYTCRYDNTVDEIPSFTINEKIIEKEDKNLTRSERVSRGGKSKEICLSNCHLPLLSGYDKDGQKIISDMNHGSNINVKINFIGTENESEIKQHLYDVKTDSPPQEISITSQLAKWGKVTIIFRLEGPNLLIDFIGEDLEESGLKLDDIILMEGDISLRSDTSDKFSSIYTSDPQSTKNDDVSSLSLSSSTLENEDSDDDVVFVNGWNAWSFTGSIGKGSKLKGPGLPDVFVKAFHHGANQEPYFRNQKCNSNSSNIYYIFTEFMLYLYALILLGNVGKTVNHYTGENTSKTIANDDETKRTFWEYVSLSFLSNFNNMKIIKSEMFSLVGNTRKDLGLVMGFLSQRNHFGGFVFPISLGTYTITCVDHSLFFIFLKYIQILI